MNSSRNRTNILFSIVTINYNNLNGLSNTVESVLHQTCDDKEFIIIDGHSKDGSIDYLNKLSLDFVSVIIEEDTGIYNAMNKGLKRCQGQFVVFMNSGDTFYDKSTLAKIQKAITSRNENTAFIYGDTVETDNDGQRHIYKRAKSHSNREYGMFAHHQSMFFRNSIINDFGIRYDESLKIAGDWGFILSYLQKIKSDDILYLDLPLCIFELGGYSANYLIGIKEQYKLRRKILGWNRFQCLKIAALHYFLNVIRKYFPFVYRAHLSYRSRKKL